MNQRLHASGLTLIILLSESGPDSSQILEAASEGALRLTWPLYLLLLVQALDLLNLLFDAMDYIYSSISTRLYAR